MKNLSHIIVEDLVMAYEIKDLEIFKRKLVKARKFIDELIEQDKSLNAYDLFLAMILNCKKSQELKEVINEYYKGIKPSAKEIVCQKCGLNKTVKYYHTTLGICDNCHKKTSGYGRFKNKKTN